MSPTFDACLATHAAERPHAPAATDTTTTLTFGELHDEVGRLAGGLDALGSEASWRVALVADNSVAHLAAALAVWRAGATLVTIYPSSTAAEVEYALDHSRPSLVVAATRVFEVVRAAGDRLGIRVLELAADGSIDGLPEAPSLTAGGADPQALALICYTSGSTSRPKAVMHSHAGLMGAAAAYADVWHLGAGDVTLVSLPLAWAFGLVTTSMAALSGGGHVVLLARSDPAALLSNLAEHEVTFFAGVTTVFVKMIDAVHDDPSLPRPTRLRLCISGGEPRNDAAFARWHELTGCPVHDVYAASECFPVVTYDPIRDPLPVPGAAGRVVPQADLRVVDGEALVRGPALMLGYLDDPELTAASLTDDGWYRTGDLVEVDERGYVYVRGRLSDMIIRGGANVSPAEVEAVLLTHPGVREAAVVGLPDPSYGEQVVAVVVPEAGTDRLDERQLAEHCAGALAGYKRPARFVVVPHLPRNANTGKVQRRQVAAELAAELAARLAPSPDTP
jgi:long-chain acyl-CoA synthetase